MGMRIGGLQRGTSILKRRGLLAGAAAVIGAGLAKLTTPGRAEAADGTPVIVGGVAEGTNPSTSSTRIAAYLANNPALLVQNNRSPFTFGPLNSPDAIQAQVDTAVGVAIRGTNVGAGDGVTGESTAGMGVQGSTSATSINVSGVRGVATSTNGVTNGVWGQNSSISGGATGVYGLASTSTGAAGTVGVWGRSQSSHPSAIGTVGEITTSGATGTGIVGRSTSGNGVLGTSTTVPGVGVVGRGPGIAIFGYSDSPASAAREGVRGESIHGPGVYGKSTNHAGVYSEGGGGNIALFGITQHGTALAAQATGTGQAALFLGNVNILGNLTVSGSYPKSAGVPHPDGSTRRMYCMEGPESWFEDVGRGQLQGGRVEIKLDADFAALVTADDYHVFLQPEGPTALYVSQRTATGFEVREVEEGGRSAPSLPGQERAVRPVTAASTVSFSYRVLAQRRDLVGKAKRMERIDMPRGVRRGGDRGLTADTALLPRVAPVSPPDLPQSDRPN